MTTSRSAQSGSTALEPRARRQGLHRTEGPGPRRWVDDDGAAVTDPAVLDRLRRLAVPPAWTGVWASADPDAPVQATGVDARGRTQYRYSARATAEHGADKFAHVVLLADALPGIRGHVETVLADGRELAQETVLAAMVRLLDRGFFRVGNDRYARDNHTYGLTTLRRDQVRVDGDRLHFDYVAKEHLHRVADVRDAEVATLVEALLDRPGDDGDPLFTVDVHGAPVHVGSSAVNTYLHGLGGAPATAKAFRTWSGTVVAAAVLGGAELDAAAKRPRSAQTAAVTAAATLLGNTPSVARASYVHPTVLATAHDASRATVEDAVGRAAERLGTRSVARIWVESDVQHAVLQLLRPEAAATA